MSKKMIAIISTCVVAVLLLVLVGFNRSKPTSSDQVDPPSSAESVAETPKPTTVPQEPKEETESASEEQTESEVLEFTQITSAQKTNVRPAAPTAVPAPAPTAKPAPQPDPQPDPKPTAVPTATPAPIPTSVPTPSPLPTPKPELVNLASGIQNLTVTMAGPGTDLDPATKDVTIKDKEKSILNRLTDGVYGNGKILDGNWNGTGERSKYYEAYRNIDRSIVIDLGAERNIRELSMHVQENPGYGISAPAFLSYYLSTDGVNFNRVSRVSRFDAVRDEEPSHMEGDETGQLINYNFTASDMNYNARYVKVSFELTGTWAFMDELEINGLTEPAKDADALPDTPGTDYEYVNAYAKPSQSRGIQHESLIYSGYWQPSPTDPFEDTHKTVQDVLSTVAYLNEDGTIQDKFFESVTLLPHLMMPDMTTEDPCDSRNMVYVINEMFGNPDAAKMCARINEWQLWLDFIFDYTDENGEKCNLAALDKAAGQVKAATNDPDYKLGVKIAITPPILCQNDFGALPGTTRSLNFEVSETNSREQALADRKAAVKWYVDTVISRFENAHFENLRFDGFYWFHESVDYDVDPLAAESVKAATEYIHSLPEKPLVYWIPSYQAPGFREWKTLGFDYAIMQPNYAFDANATDQRVDDCADLSKQYGLGVEMEFGGISDKFISTFRDYLIKGQADKKGYQHDSLVAWYTSTWGIRDTCNNVGDTRYIYDAMYQFFKGIETDMESPVPNLAANAKISVSAQDVKDPAALEKLNLSLLTDGKSGNWNETSLQFNANALAGNITLTTDLGGVSSLEKVGLNTIEIKDWGVGAPDQVTFSTSMNGKEWSEPVTVKRDQATVVPGDANSVIYAVDLKQDAQYIKAEFTYGTVDGSAYTWLGLDELVINGSSPRPTSGSIASFAKVSLESEVVGNAEAFANIQALAAKKLTDNDFLTGDWSGVNTETGHYLGIIKSTAEGPYTVSARFPKSAQVNSLSMSFGRCAGDGIGAPDQVTYYYQTADSADWTELGTVTKADALISKNIAGGWDGYNYEFKAEKPIEAAAFKAVFQREMTPEEMWWIAPDEFLINGSLSDVTPSPDPDPKPDPIPTPSFDSIASNATLSLEGEGVSDKDAFAGIQAVADTILKDGDVASGKWEQLNKNDGHYIGIVKGVAEGPYTVSAKFQKVAKVDALTLCFADWLDSGVAPSDQVTYYYQKPGSEQWELAGTVERKKAYHTTTPTQGFNSYCFELKLKEPVEISAVKAVFSRCMTPEEMWWVALDEFVIHGTLTETPVQNRAEETLPEEKPLEELIPAEKSESAQGNEEQALPEEMPLEELIPAEKLESAQGNDEQTLPEEKLLEELIPAEKAEPDKEMTVEIEPLDAAF